MKNKLDLRMIRKASEVLKCLSHPERLRIVEHLERGHASVSELMTALKLPQVKVSKQLAVLKKGGIVESRIERHFRYYTIVYPNVLNILNCIRSHGGKSK